MFVIIFIFVIIIIVENEDYHEHSGECSENTIEYIKETELQQILSLWVCFIYCRTLRAYYFLRSNLNPKKSSEPSSERIKDSPDAITIELVGG